MTASPRRRRLRLPWLLAIPFLLLAQPTPLLLLAGFLLALPGLLLRGISAGYIDKDRELAVRGPYARIRHPLYVGSFLVGLGLVVAGIPLGFFLYPLLFLWVYAPSLRQEREELSERFGERYEAYVNRVPPFLPRWKGDPTPPPSPWNRGDGEISSGGAPDGFQPELYLRNREWEALLGVMAGFGLLWLRMALFP